MTKSAKTRCGPQDRIRSIVDNTRLPNRNIIQSLMIQRIKLSSSSNVSPSVLEYVNSILAAVVPERELTEASRDPETFAQTPLQERPWYEGLPADVKEYLAIVAQANQRPKESWQVGARKVRAGKVAVDNDRRDSDEQPVPVGQRQDVI